MAGLRNDTDAAYAAAHGRLKGSGSASALAMARAPGGHLPVTRGAISIAVALA